MDVYENQERAADRALLENEKIPFAVLYRIMNGPLRKLATDHHRIIIAHSSPAFPAWIWAPDDVTDTELETIYETVRAEFTPVRDYRFNTKYGIAEYLIRRLKEDGIDYRIGTNIATYECPHPVPPGKHVPGHRDLLTESEAELTAGLIREAAFAIGKLVLTEEESLAAAKELLARKALYVWRDESGREVSFCEKRAESDEYTAVSQCYTPEDFRGNGYAGQLICEVCRDIVSEGKTPMIYADADYAPSNRCYQKIGFKLKAKIATIVPGRETENRPLSPFLAEQRKRYPLMNEEDVVKFVFQGMMGVGHLIRSEEGALQYLQAEMADLEPDGEEPLTERISPEWLRLNLRAAMARGMTPEEIAHMVFLSAQEKPLPYTRQDVYDLCTGLDGSDGMKAAAGKVLDENWLPRHSERYREAYRPAYRVLHQNCLKLIRGPEITPE